MYSSAMSLPYLEKKSIYVSNTIATFFYFLFDAFYAEELIYAGDTHANET